MKAAIRLIAMDMDGTLLDPDQKLSEGNRLALLRAQTAGIRLAVCSGRMPGDIGCFLEEHQLENIAILGLNGCCCQMSFKEPPYANHVLPADTALRCCRRFAEAGVTHGLFLQDRVVVFEGHTALRRCDWGSYWDIPGAPVMSFGGDVAHLAAQGVNKMVVIEDDLELLKAVRAALADVAAEKKLQITTSWANNIELMPANVEKGQVVQALAQQLGLDNTQVMALGDFDNDLSMFRYAEFAVAMGNAPAHVQAAADAVTLTNAQDGVAHAIKKWALAGRR